MQHSKYIESLQNPLIKKIITLKEKNRGRKKTGRFVLEGTREFEMAKKGKYQIETVFYHEPIISTEEVYALSDKLPNTPDLIKVSKEVYQRIAYREKTEGVLAIAVAKTHHLEDLSFKGDQPLVLVMEAPEKPGNIGAMLRTADAANLDAVIIADPLGDLYNPNVVRSSVGCLFTVNIGIGNTTEVLEFLKKRKITIYSAALSAQKRYHEVDYTKASAIVVGTESTGLSTQWLDSENCKVIIPMQGEIDSMNVSVSAAILIFEAKRQRAFN